MKQTHTPGPWITHGLAIYSHSGASHIVQVSPLWPHESLKDNPEAMSNARLISAAPDLLACLKAAEQEIRLTAAIYEQENKPEIAKELRSHAAIYAKTIAKAEGNANP